MAITRKDAKLIAEELFKLLRGDVKEATKEVTKVETEEYLTPKEVGLILGWHPCTVRKKKNDLKCYVTINKRLYFVKSQLHKMIQAGLI